MNKHEKWLLQDGTIWDVIRSPNNHFFVPKFNYVFTKYEFKEQVSSRLGTQITNEGYYAKYDKSFK